MFPSESCNEDNGAGLPWPKSSYCVYSFNISSFKGEDSTFEEGILFFSDKSHVTIYCHRKRFHLVSCSHYD